MARKKTTAKVAGRADDLGSIGFDDAVERLEAIIERVESGEIGLEQALSEYERGMKLVKRCRDILGQVEQRVEELSREARAQAESAEASDGRSE